MANRIREIESVLGASGRQNKYRVSFTFPPTIGINYDLQEVDILAKSSAAPQKEIGIIELWNQGRKLPIPGDTTFDNTWTCSFYLGESHEIRLAMLKWQDAADNFYINKHSGDPSEIMTDIRIEQLDSAGKPTAIYTLHNSWPSVVGAVTYDDSAEKTPTEFDFPITYSDWTIGTGEESDYTPIKATKNPTAL